MAIPPVFGTIRAWSHYHDENGHAIFLLSKYGKYVAIGKIWRNSALVSFWDLGALVIALFPLSG